MPHDATAPLDATALPNVTALPDATVAFEATASARKPGATLASVLKQNETS